jgi:hypothetical protein
VSQRIRLIFSTKYEQVDLVDVEAKYQKRQELLAKSAHWFAAATTSGSSQAGSFADPSSHGLPFSKVPVGRICEQQSHDSSYSPSITPYAPLSSTNTYSSPLGVTPVSPASDIGTLSSETFKTQTGNDYEAEPGQSLAGFLHEPSRILHTEHQSPQKECTLDNYPSISPDLAFPDYTHERTDTSAADPDFYSPGFDFGWNQPSTAGRDDGAVTEDHSTRQSGLNGDSMADLSNPDPPFDLDEFVRTAYFDDVWESDETM